MKRFKALGMIIITVFLCLSLADTAFGDTVTLTAVPYAEQEEDQWCWAASCEMLLGYHGISVSQSTLAYYGVEGYDTWNYLWGEDYCSGPCCNDSIYRVGMEILIGNYYGVSNNHSGALLYYDDYGWTRDVWHEIRAGRPFIINWLWYGDCAGGHLLVGFGYEDGYIHYYDPWYGVGYCVDDYSTVVDDSIHNWTYSLWPTDSPYVPVVDDYASGSNAIVYPVANTTLEYQNPCKYKCSGNFWVDTRGTTWDSYCSSGWEAVY